MTLDSIITAEQLATHLPDDTLCIADLRDADTFAAGHIAGARWLDRQLLNRADPPAVGLLPDARMLDAIAAALDLREGQHVIALDAGKATDAARLIWVLQAWSIDAASWLDGGMAAWHAAQLPLQAGTASSSGDATGGATGDTEGATNDRVPPRVVPALIARNRVTADELLAELADPALRVLDVRSAAEFSGSDVRSAFGGHVPGARHLEWTTQLGADGRVRPNEALRAQLEAIDVRPEHRVVVYCQSHQRSSVTWQVLRALGYPDVRGLDGAWSVWGNRADLPKEGAPIAGA